VKFGTALVDEILTALDRQLGLARAGRYELVYGSNWGRYSPADYTDAYEVRLPAGWDE